MVDERLAVLAVDVERAEVLLKRLAEDEAQLVGRPGQDRTGELATSCA
jgi:hypothetical protein